jgi:hypothetical protein
VGLSGRPLDQLSPESRAVLSLVLLQSRSYTDIANLLRLGGEDVRERAHLAAGSLVTAVEAPGADTQAQIIDYMLGEQSVSARAQTRSELIASELARSWATALAQALAPLAKSPLPAIPDTAPAPPPATPAPPQVAPVARAGRPPAAAFAPPTPPPARLLVPGLVAVAVIVVAIILVAGGGSSNGPSGGHPTRAIAKLALKPTGSNPNASGTGSLVRQKGGLLLLLTARGLAPNRHDAYAVWLFNSPADARLLGFVSPAVGATGRFASGVTLPGDASRFHSLIVTLERSSRPMTPGQTVLRTPLALS